MIILVWITFMSHLNAIYAMLDQCWIWAKRLYREEWKYRLVWLTLYESRRSNDYNIILYPSKCSIAIRSEIIGSDTDLVIIYCHTALIRTVGKSNRIDIPNLLNRCGQKHLPPKAWKHGLVFVISQLYDYFSYPSTGRALEEGPSIFCISTKHTTLPSREYAAIQCRRGIIDKSGFV